ncbi:hypothetical protein EMIT0196P_30246 [Pseudomonas chlororaphis]
MVRMKAHDARMRPTAGPHLLTFPLSPSFTRRHLRHSRLDRLDFWSASSQLRTFDPAYLVEQEFSTPDLCDEVYLHGTDTRTANCSP